MWQPGPHDIQLSALETHKPIDNRSVQKSKGLVQFFCEVWRCTDLLARRFRKIGLRRSDGSQAGFRIALRPLSMFGHNCRNGMSEHLNEALGSSLRHQTDPQRRVLWSLSILRTGPARLGPMEAVSLSDALEENSLVLTVHSKVPLRRRTLVIKAIAGTLLHLLPHHFCRGPAKFRKAKLQGS